MFVFVKHKKQEEHSVAEGNMISMQQIGDNMVRTQITNRYKLTTHITKTKIG